MTAMKSEAEIQRAILLISLLLANQVQLPQPMPPAAVLNLHGVARALHWMLSMPDHLPLENLLSQIEKAAEGPGFNPHQTRVE